MSAVVLDEKMTAAALRELALEEQAAIDRVLDATVERAHSRSVVEVETMLRRRLAAEGVSLGADVAGIAQQIVAALRPGSAATSKSN